jgi:cytochrome c oxidase subunit 4
MRGLLASRLTVSLLLLVGATFLSLDLVNVSLFHGDRRAITVGVLLIAFGKVCLVGLEFVGLRNAPWIARLAFAAWLIAVCSTLIALNVLKIHL